MHIETWTLALQTVNFLVLVWLLQRFLYRPVMGAIDQRRVQSERILSEADAARAAALGESQTWRAKIDAVAGEREVILRDAHASATQERNVILDTARREAALQTASALQALATERDEALLDLKRRAAGLAVRLARALVRDTSSFTPSDVFLPHLEAQLAAMSDAERAQLATSGDMVRVVTAQALDDGARRQWEERLGRHLTGAPQFEFVEDEDLIAGAQVEFPGTLLSLNWADALIQAEEALLQEDEVHVHDATH